MSASDSVCGILILACFDVVAGICLDFISLRECIVSRKMECSVEAGADLSSKDIIARNIFARYADGIARTRITHQSGTP